MKWVLISDLHFKTSDWMASIEEYTGLFFPRENLYKCVDLVKEHNCNGILVLGDVFDRPLNSHFLVHNVISIFEDIASRVPNIVILLGNHDIAKTKMYNVDDETIPYTTLLGLKRENIHVVTTVEYLNNNIVLVPYTERRLLVENRENWEGTTVVTHIGVSGLEIKTGVSIPDEFSFEMLSSYHKVLTGHYHKPQSKGNITVVGSPWAVRNDELFDEKYVWLWDVENDTLSPIPSITPKVVPLEVNSLKQMTDLERFIKNKLSNSGEEVFVKFLISVSDSKLLPHVQKLSQKFKGHIIVNYKRKNIEKEVMRAKSARIDSDNVITMEQLLSDFLTPEEWTVLVELGLTKETLFRN